MPNTKGTWPWVRSLSSLGLCLRPAKDVTAQQYKIFLLIDLYWSIVASQYCVNFCCTTKWISHMHTHVPISPPSWASLPSSLSHPSRSLQSTKPISLCYAAAPSSQLFYILYCIYVNATLTSPQLPPPTPCPQVHSLCLPLYSCPAARFISTIFFFIRFHIYALAYGISFSLSDLLHSVW